MKTITAVLIAVLVIHMQCRISCLAQQPGSTDVPTTNTGAEPPCHQHPDAPPKPAPPSHETDSSCSQGLVSALQVTVTGKNLLLPLAAVLPVVVTVESFRDNVVPILETMNALLVSSPPTPFSILRI